jgi:hypothetical protein
MLVLPRVACGECAEPESLEIFDDFVFLDHSKKENGQQAPPSEATMNSERKFVSRLEDIPTIECWVIIKALTVHHEGDERSRTAPGHGYPAGTDNYVQVYEVFTSEEAFKAELAKELKSQHYYCGNSIQYAGSK